MAANESSTCAAAPREVYHWIDRDRVQAFDAAGRQIGQLQGKHRHVRARVLAAADEHTRFYRGTWGEEWAEVERGAW